MMEPIALALTFAVISIGLSGCDPRLIGTIMKGVGDGIVEYARHQAELRRAYILACAPYGEHCDKI